MRERGHLGTEDMTSTYGISDALTAEDKGASFCVKISFSQQATIATAEPLVD